MVVVDKESLKLARKVIDLTDDVFDKLKEYCEDFVNQVCEIEGTKKGRLAMELTVASTLGQAIIQHFHRLLDHYIQYRIELEMKERRSHEERMIRFGG